VAEIRAELAPGTPVEVWFQDEMRVGQKNKLTYRWARKGARPRAIHDQRTQSTYLFGAVCPDRGTGAALVLPACNSEAMQLHLDEIATKVARARHSHPRSSRLARGKGTQDSNQHLAPAVAAALTRAQQPREHLAVHAPELAVEPNLQILRRHRRSLLLRLEHPHRPAMEDNVHRATRLGHDRSLIVRIGIRRQPAPSRAIQLSPIFT
jgi:DDE superfamily endonuclease